MDDPLAADWLRPTVFQRRDRRPIYFYGLASHRTAPPRAAYSVLKRLGRAVAAANMPVDFIFETTERSEQYLPSLIDTYARALSSRLKYSVNLGTRTPCITGLPTPGSDQGRSGSPKRA